MSNTKDFIEKEGEIFPGRTYVEELLKPVFNDQRDYLFHSMFELHKAHVVMLEEQRLLSKKDAYAILHGIEKLSKTDLSTVTYDPQYEDLFFMMESKLGDLIGEDLAGKVHMARSRNDMGEAMYRIVIRQHILTLLTFLDDLSEALLEKAEKYVHAIMPAHTHTQPAQPTTFGHYLLAIFDNLQRDRKRFWSAYHTVNCSPLGAAAITTTGFNINRERLMELLGFQDMIENSYDAIGTGDYLLESAQSIISLMVNTGRWIQEFLRFASREVGLIKVADPYVQISSIMPQKRNPVSVEHSRAIASSSCGEANTVIQMLHNTPYGDIVDTEDDLQPILYSSYQKAFRVLKLMKAVVRTISFNEEHAEKQARKNLIVITELADVLTRDYGVTFRKAHRFAAKIATISVEKNMELSDWQVEKVNALLGDVNLKREDWEAIIDPNIFVKRRSVRGGPSPVETNRMVLIRKQKLMEDKAVTQDMKDKLTASKTLLDNCVKSLLNK